MHRVLLREVVIDVPSEQLDATRRFWAGALERGCRAGKSLPSQYRNIDVSRINLDRETGAAGHFCSDF